MKAIDLFSGLGGFSQGARMAGIDVVWAANHWPAAVDIHSQNHPGAEHACQDLQQTNWRDVPAHDLMLASPCCQGHSKARGKANGNPQHDASRSTAWAPVTALEYHRPKLALIENVTDLTAWVLYPAWCAALNALGYALTPMIVDAADHGVPQHRERLFIALALGKYPLEIKLPRREHVPASSFIDFDASNWQPIEKPGRAANTLARVAAGRASFGDRFLMPYYGGGSGLTGRSLRRPVGTITTRDRWGGCRRRPHTDAHEGGMPGRHGLSGRLHPAGDAQGRRNDAGQRRVAAGRARHHHRNDGGRMNYQLEPTNAMRSPGKNSALKNEPRRRVSRRSARSHVSWGVANANQVGHPARTAPVQARNFAGSIGRSADKRPHKAVIPSARKTQPIVQAKELNTPLRKVCWCSAIPGSIRSYHEALKRIAHRSLGVLQSMFNLSSCQKGIVA